MRGKRLAYLLQKRQSEIFFDFCDIIGTAMSKPRIVLVLGDDDGSQLVETLFRFGITPIVHDDMRTGLNKLRHGRFDAIFVDRDHLEADVIEFALNVRDFDVHIPIIAAGKPANSYENRVLLQQPNVFVFEDVPDVVYDKVRCM